jgi:hypothetical protein
MENPKKLAKQGTQVEDKQNDNTTQYVLDTSKIVQHNNSTHVTLEKKDKDIKPLTTQTLSEPEVRLSGPEV